MRLEQEQHQSALDRCTRRTRYGGRVPPPYGARRRCTRGRASSCRSACSSLRVQLSGFGRGTVSSCSTNRGDSIRRCCCDRRRACHAWDGLRNDDCCAFVVDAADEDRGENAVHEQAAHQERRHKRPSHCARRDVGARGLLGKHWHRVRGIAVVGSDEFRVPQRDTVEVVLQTSRFFQPRALPLGERRVNKAELGADGLRLHRRRRRLSVAADVKPSCSRADHAPNGRRHREERASTDSST